MVKQDPKTCLHSGSIYIRIQDDPKDKEFYNKNIVTCFDCDRKLVNVTSAHVLRSLPLIANAAPEVL